MKNKEKVLIVYPNYIELFKQLDREYALTPGWRWIRQFKILNRMHRLNKVYGRWLDEQLSSD